MKKYATKQREELMNFFEKNPDRQFTAGQIAEALSNGKISKSSVYRNLNELEKEGTISRAVKESCREAVYQYTKAKKCKNAIHLACIKCGSIKHMNKESARKVREAVVGTDGFYIGNAFVYGICQNCEK